MAKLQNLVKRLNLPGAGTLLVGERQANMFTLKGLYEGFGRRIEGGGVPPSSSPPETGSPLPTAGAGKATPVTQYPGSTSSTAPAAAIVSGCFVQHLAMVSEGWAVDIFSRMRS